MDEREAMIARLGREHGAELIQLIEAAGVPFDSLDDGEGERLARIVLEEGQNVLVKTAAEAKRLKARGELGTAAARLALTKKILSGVAELTAKRFLAGRVQRHGP